MGKVTFVKGFNEESAGIGECSWCHQPHFAELSRSNFHVKRSCFLEWLRRMAPNLGCTDSLLRTDLLGEYIKGYQARQCGAAFEAGVGESPGLGTAVI